MAKQTNLTLRKQVIYSIFIRNHTAEGTFAAAQPDLERIKFLGADIVWLMPVHPIGKTNRKGTLGSPYAISDYREINPEYGDMEDFERFVAAVHAQGMKCIIDVVYNHTSPDSWLAQNHPEWFYRTPEGNLGNRTADWTDVVDLDYSNQELWDYQIETLKRWALLVDGFRCDVAPLVPIEFWLKAREEVEKVRPGAIWLSESIEPEFIISNRHRGFTAHSDCEIYQAFDISYDYDIFLEITNYIKGKITLERLTEALERQEYSYPAEYIKLRFLENHDQPRAHSLITDPSLLYSWTALIYMLKGTALIYAGQEICASKTPSLFDKDTIDWSEGKDISFLLKSLRRIRRDDLFVNGNLSLLPNSSEDILAVGLSLGDSAIFGAFRLKGRGGMAHLNLPDGAYADLISGKIVEVKNNMAPLSRECFIIKTNKFTAED